MPNIFDSIKVLAPKRNVFDLTHDVKLSMNMGQLVPTLAMECVPGDKVKLGCSSIVRFAPLLAPVMHRYDVSMHYFFVPNRITWKGFENYITNTPENGLPVAFPTLALQNVSGSKLSDYLGIEAGFGSNFAISALPFAAYQMIYDEYYRDQNNIPTAVNYALNNGSNDANADLLVLRRRAWEHDYLTSALPFAQKGPQVDIPMTFGDVGIAVNHGSTGTQEYLTTTPTGINALIDTDDTPTNPPVPISQDELYAKTSDLTGNALISDLRRATKLQEWMERAARGGSRYVEHIKNFFNVQSSDKRLQRPEYITGIKTPVTISEVLNTTGTADAPQGDMAGHAVSVSGGKYGSYYCEEHGYIIGIMSVMPKPAYQQGVPRHFLKVNDPFEFFYPQFENIGEQPIYNAEVVVPQNQADIFKPFGYTPRYSEYKFMANRVAGQFRTTLNFWHNSRIFAGPQAPPLNKEFIECNPDTRVFAVTNPNDDHLYCQVLHEISAVRPMAKYGTPSFG